MTGQDKKKYTRSLYIVIVTKNMKKKKQQQKFMSVLDENLTRKNCSHLNTTEPTQLLQIWMKS